jgi:ABC-2 type transport system permease protein
MTEYGSAALAIFRRDFAMFASYRLRFVTTMVSLIVSMTLFYYVSRLVRADSVGSSDQYYAFVVVGLIILGVLTSTLSLPVATLRSELLAGTFERMIVSPFGPVRAVMSLLLFPVALSFVTATLSLLYATLVFGLDLRWPDALLGFPVALLAAAAFAPFGLLMCAGVVIYKQTNAGASFVVTGMTLVAGLYFPVSLLPDWIRWASDVQPFTPAVDLLRHLLVGTPLRDGSPLGDLLRIVGFLVVLMPLAVWALNGAVRLARRRGTLTEY